MHILLTDQDCRPIVTTQRRTAATAVLDALNAELARARQARTEPEPIVFIPGHLAPIQLDAAVDDEASSSDEDSSDAGYGAIDDDAEAGGAKTWGGKATAALSTGETGGTAACHVVRKDLRLIAAVARDVDPAVPFAFLDALARVLEDYFGEASEATVKDNFEIVLQILEEALAPPHPILTDSTTLKELVPPPSVLAKLLSAANAALGQNQGPANTGPIQSVLTSPLPWRKQGIRHKTNEIYFDIVEQVNAIVDRTGKPISSEIWGWIECRCKLTGMPDLLMSLSHPNQLEDCSFHPCVRLAKWQANRTLSFVPPDGRFTLMSYRLGPPPTLAAPNTPLVASGLPVQLRPTVTIGSAGGAFSLLLTSRLPPTLPIEDVLVSFKLGPHAGDVSALTSGGPKLDANAGTAEAAQRWAFDAESGTLRWQLAKLSATDRPAALNGTWLSRCVPGVASPLTPQRTSCSTGYERPGPIQRTSDQSVRSTRHLAQASRRQLVTVQGRAADAALGLNRLSMVVNCTCSATVL